MTAGLGALRLPPQHFWSMTPRELGLALRSIDHSPPAANPPGRSDLAALMARFPDQ
jgi:uncharacterized phage protein (TIGR02216 family)